MRVQTQTESAAASQLEGRVTRREFCDSLALASAALVVAAPGLTANAAVPQDDPALAYPPLKIEGAERLLPGSALYFTYPTRRDPAVLARAADGQFYAFSQKCTHRGCSVYFDPGRGCLECPCHKGAFDLRSGDAMYGPPPRPLDQISLQMRAGGEIWATGKRGGGRGFYVAE
jgi:Rieske Fe-S protein